MSTDELKKWSNRTQPQSGAQTLDVVMVGSIFLSKEAKFCLPQHLKAVKTESLQNKMLLFSILLEIQSVHNETHFYFSQK